MGHDSHFVFLRAAVLVAPRAIRIDSLRRTISESVNGCGNLPTSVEAFIDEPVDQTACPVKEAVNVTFVLIAKVILW